MNKPKKDKLSKLRHGLDQKTNIYRLIHGAADGWKGLYVDRLGDYLLIQSSQSLNGKQKEAIQLLAAQQERVIISGGATLVAMLSVALAT